MPHQILVKQNVWEKTEREIVFNLPTEPIYLFMYGERISIKVVPVYTSWKMENDSEPT